MTELKLWTIEQLAGFLQVSTKWIYEEAIPHDGVPVKRLGRASRVLRVVPDEIMEWLAGKGEPDVRAAA